VRTYFSIFEIKKNVKKTLVFALLPFLRIFLARMHCSGKEKKVFEITSYLVRQDLKVVFVERRLTKKCQILSKFMVVQFHPPPLPQNLSQNSGYTQNIFYNFFKI
jgi:hypothetical protein